MCSEENSNNRSNKVYISYEDRRRGSAKLERISRYGNKIHHRLDQLYSAREYSLAVIEDTV